MAYKKIEIANCNYCPACKSKKGLKFHKLTQVKYLVKWGKHFKKIDPEKPLSVSGVNTNAKCVDCDKTYTII